MPRALRIGTVRAVAHRMAAEGGWPLLMVGAVAWVAMAGDAHGAFLPGLCGDHGVLASDAPPILAMLIRLNLTPMLPLGWLLMLAAMMMPLVLRPIARIRANASPYRRPGAVIAFLSGYAVLWMAALALLWIAGLMVGMMWGDARIAFAATLGLALIWQGMPAKGRFLRRCHAMPAMRVSGLGVEFDSLLHGAANALPCIGTCWAMMMVSTASPFAHFAVMALAALAMLCERHAPLPRAGWRWPFVCAGLLLLAAARLL